MYFVFNFFLSIAVLTGVVQIVMLFMFLSEMLQLAGPSFKLPVNMVLIIFGIE